MPKLVLRNKVTNKEFEILGFNKEAQTIRLKGPNTEFDEPYKSKEDLERLGYVIEQQV